ncbi:MAG: hypothetical protein EOM14_02115, partial [Clostridia bacterium]|nr:hypothetical protein [Clostridia bacterium]
MKKNNAETILAEAVKAATPDCLDAILSECQSKRGAVINMDEINNSAGKNGNKGWAKKIVATAAAVAVIIGCSIGFGTYQKAQAVGTVVSVDAGSAVSVGVNDNNVVVSVSENTAGVAKSDVKGMQADEAVKTIVTKMAENGDINNQDNIILLSVQKMSEEATDEIDDAQDEHNEGVEDVKNEINSELSDAINEALDEMGIDGTVIDQEFASDEMIAEIADEFSISEGKVSFIQKILGTTEDEDTQVGDLADLSISKIIEYAANYFKTLGLEAGTAEDSDSDITGAINNAIGTGVNVSVGTDANVSVNGSSGSFSTSVEADDGQVKVDVGSNSNDGSYYLGVEVEGESFKYD